MGHAADIDIQQAITTARTLPEGSSLAGLSRPQKRENRAADFGREFWPAVYVFAVQKLRRGEPAYDKLKALSFTP